MKRELDIGYFNEVLHKHYESKADMARSIGISRSHMQEIFKSKGIGEKFLRGLQKESIEKGFDFYLCFRPDPILMNGEYVDSIVITDEEGGLIASVSSRDAIVENGTKVIVVPYYD